MTILEGSTVYCYNGSPVFLFCRKIPVPYWKSISSQPSAYVCRDTAILSKLK